MGKQKDNIEFDDFDFGDDFSFDDEGPGGFAEVQSTPVSTKREVATGLAEGLRDGVRDHALSTDTHKRIIRAALPEEYSTAYNTALQTTQDARALYDTTTKELGQIHNQLKIKAQPYVDKLGKKLPTKIAKKVELWSRSARTNQLTTANPEELEMANTMASIFGNLQQTADRAVSNELNQQQTQEAKVQTRLSADGNQIMSLVARDTAKLVSYQDSVLIKFQQKSLELQYKSVFLQTRQLTTLDNLHEISKTGYEQIIKNTGLPEAVKLRNSEYFTNEMKNRLWGKVADTATNKLSDIRGELLKRGQAKITEKSKEFQDMLSQFADGGEMLAQMLGDGDGEDGGMGPSMTISNLLASMVGGAAGGRLSGTIEKHITKRLKTWAKDNDKVKNGATKLEHIRHEGVRGLLQLLQEEGNSGIPMLDNLLQVLNTSSLIKSKSQTVRGSMFDVMDEVALFDQRAHKTLVEIIPSLLGKIHGEVKTIRTLKPGGKDLNVDETTYDWEAGRFSTTSEINSKIKKRFDDKAKEGANSAIRLQAKIHEIIRPLIEGGLDRKAISAITNELIKESQKPNPNYNITSWANPANNPIKNEAVRNEVSMAIAAITGDDSSMDTLDDTGKERFNRLRESVKNGNLDSMRFSNSINSAMKNHEDVVGDLQAMGQRLTRAGLSDNLVQTGTAKLLPDGSIVMDADRAIELIQKKSNLLGVTAYNREIQEIRRNKFNAAQARRRQEALDEGLEYEVEEFDPNNPDHVDNHALGGTIGNFAKGGRPKKQNRLVRLKNGVRKKTAKMGRAWDEAMEGEDGASAFLKNLKEAMLREERQGGKNPQAVVVSEGEEVLSKIKGDAGLFRKLKANGVWDTLKESKGNLDKVLIDKKSARLAKQQAEEAERLKSLQTRFGVKSKEDLTVTDGLKLVNEQLMSLNQMMSEITYQMYEGKLGGLHIKGIPLSGLLKKPQWLKNLRFPKYEGSHLQRWVGKAGTMRAKMIGAVSDNIGKARNYVGTKWSTVKQGYNDWLDGKISLTGKLWNGVKSLPGKAWGGIKKIPGKAIGAVTKVYRKFKPGGVWLKMPDDKNYRQVITLETLKQGTLYDVNSGKKVSSISDITGKVISQASGKVFITEKEFAQGELASGPDGIIKRTINKGKAFVKAMASPITRLSKRIKHSFRESGVYIKLPNEALPRLVVTETQMRSGRIKDVKSGKIIRKMSDITGAVQSLDGHEYLSQKEFDDGTLITESGTIIGNIRAKTNALVKGAGNMALRRITSLRPEKGVFLVMPNKKPRLIISPIDLKAGRYIDEGTGKRIKKAEDITGAIKDGDGGYVLTQAQFEEGVLTNGNGSIFVGVYQKLKNGLLKAKSIGGAVAAGAGLIVMWGAKKLNNLRKKVMSFFDFAQDVYVPGETTPRLTAVGFKNKIYKLVDGTPVTGPKQFAGNIYNLDGDVVITEAELRAGVVDKHGKPFQSFMAKTWKRAKATGKFVADKVTGFAKWGWDKIKKFGSGVKKTTLAIGGFLKKVVMGTIGGIGSFFSRIADNGLGVSILSFGMQSKTVQKLEEIRLLLDHKFNPDKAFNDKDNDGKRDGSAPDEQKEDEQKVEEKAKKEAKKATDKTNGLLSKLGDKMKGMGSGLLNGLGGMLGMLKPLLMMLGLPMLLAGGIRMGKNMLDNVAKGDGALGWLAKKVVGDPNKQEPALDANGQPVIGADGQPVMQGKKDEIFGVSTGKVMAGAAGAYLLRKPLGSAARGAWTVGKGVADGVGWLARNQMVRTAAAAGGRMALTAGAGMLSGAGTIGSAALGVLTGPVGWAIMGGLAIYAGYKLYKRFSEQKHNQLFVFRMGQYGFKFTDKDAVEKIINLEQFLLKYTDKGTETNPSTINSKAPEEEAIKIMGLDTSDEDQMERWRKWFFCRFKPVYLTWVTQSNRLLKTTDLHSLDDKAGKLDKLGLLNNVHFTRAEDNPYDIKESPFSGWFSDKLDLDKVDVNDLHADMLASVNKMKDSGLTREQKIQKESEGQTKDTRKEIQKEAVSGKPKDENKGFWSNLFNTAFDGSKKLNKMMYGEKIGGWLNNLADKEVSMFKSAWNTTKEAAGSVGNAVSNTYNSVVDGVSNAMTSVSNFLTGGGSGNYLTVPKARGKGWANVKDTIVAAARIVGVDPGLLAGMAAQESTFDPNAKSNDSSATGLFQFLDDTWNDEMRKYASKFGIPRGAKPTDSAANALLGAQFVKDNIEALKNSGQVTPGDVYLAHFLGRGGAKKFIAANQNASAASLDPQAAGSNKSIFYDNGRPRTVAQMRQHLTSLMINKHRSLGVDIPIGGGAGTNAPTVSIPTAKPPAKTPAVTNPIAAKKGAPAVAPPTKPFTSAIATNAVKSANSTLKSNEVKIPYKTGMAPASEKNAKPVPYASPALGTVAKPVAGQQEAPASSGSTATPWMDIAKSQLGVNENANNAKVSEYHRVGGNIGAGGKTPWCASFVGWCLAQAGIKGTGSAAAISYSTYGSPAPSGQYPYGAILVFKLSGGNHVSFCGGTSGNRVISLGGNQSSKAAGSQRNGGEVTMSHIPMSNVVAVRLPSGYVGGTGDSTAPGSPADQSANGDSGGEWWQKLDLSWMRDGIKTAAGIGTGIWNGIKSAAQSPAGNTVTTPPKEAQPVTKGDNKTAVAPAPASKLSSDMKSVAEQYQAQSGIASPLLGNSFVSTDNTNVPVATGVEDVIDNSSNVMSSLASQQSVLQQKNMLIEQQQNEMRKQQAHDVNLQLNTFMTESIQLQRAMNRNLETIAKYVADVAKIGKESHVIAKEQVKQQTAANDAIMKVVANGGNVATAANNSNAGQMTVKSNEVKSPVSMRIKY